MKAAPVARGKSVSPMSSLLADDVTQIARLARLALSPAETEAMQSELSAILVHMDALAEVDTTNVEPMTHAVPQDVPLRADEVGPSLAPEAALAQAPDRDGDSFRVPNVIKKSGEAS